MRTSRLKSATSALKMERVCSVETLESADRSTRHQNSEQHVIFTAVKFSNLTYECIILKNVLNYIIMYVNAE
jgi:hypothetical protein